jgi:hypothetical protein
MLRDWACSLRLFDFKDRLNLDGYSRGKRRKTNRTACVVSITVLAIEFVQQIGSPVDDEMLIGKGLVRINTAEQLDHAQTVESSVSVVNRSENLFAAVAGGIVSLVNRDTLSKNPLLIADVTGGDELISAANAEIQVSLLLRRKINSEFLGFFRY